MSSNHCHSDIFERHGINDSIRTKQPQFMINLVFSSCFVMFYLYYGIFMDINFFELCYSFRNIIRWFERNTFNKINNKWDIMGAAHAIYSGFISVVPLSLPLKLKMMIYCGVYNAEIHLRGFRENGKRLPPVLYLLY